MDTVNQAASWVAPLIEKGTDIGTMVLGALVLWIVGRVVIGMIRRAIGAAMGHRKVDPTLVKYADSAAEITLNVILIIAVLSVFGVETTTFAGLLAAAGVAIGMAWSGLLSNFAAGIFLLLLRPFKVGDFIQAGGVMGTVETIGLFVTAIDTLDHVRHYVGNNAIFSGVIQNYTTNPHRRVELLAQLNHDADVPKAIEVLQGALAKIPNVKSDPAPEVDIVTFTLAGPVLAVRPYCHNDHYWQVYFATNMAIREELGAAGFNVPEQHFHVATAAK